MLELYDNVDVKSYLNFLLITTSQLTGYTGDEIRFLRKSKVINQNCLVCNEKTLFQRNTFCKNCKGNEYKIVTEAIKNYLKKL